MIRSTCTTRSPLEAACGFAKPFLCALTLVGCASQPQPGPRHGRDPDPPELREVRGNMPERAQEIIPTNFDLRGIASFQQVQLPLDQPSDEAWKVVNEGAFPAITRGVWNSNGLRFGLLPRGKLEEFMQKLPPATGLGQSQLVGSEHPSPILRTPPLRRSVDVDMTIPPMPVSVERVIGGRLQMLARLTRDDRGVLVIDLMPHHHVPRITLPEVRKIDGKFVAMPRDELEKELDGRIFDQLAVRAEVQPGMLLVVGLYRPWPTAPVQEAPGAEPIIPPELVAPPPQIEGEEVASLAPADPPAVPAEVTELQDPPAAPPAPAPAVQAPPLPNNLGRALFAGVALGRPQQTILVIAIEPLRGPTVQTPAPAAPPQP